MVGPPPGKGAPRSERLRWIRRLNWRLNTPFAALGLVLLLVYAPWYFAAAGAALQTYTLVSISLKIGREERKEHAGGS